MKVIFFSIQEYSVQLTFRQDWLDPRLAYPNTDGKQDSHTNKLKTNPWYHRETEVPNHDRPRQGVDARYFLSKRENRPLPQHHRAQRLHPNLPKWKGPLQHKVGN